MRQRYILAAAEVVIKGCVILKIADLRPGQGRVNIEVEVVSVGEVRTFQKYGRSGRVATAVVKDESGDEINLSLWNEDIDMVSPVSGRKAAYRWKVRQTCGPNRLSLPYIFTTSF